MDHRKCRNCAHHYEENSISCDDCEPIYVNWEPMKQPALNKQEGGNHYKDKGIQPIVYIHANNMGFCDGNVVKYITRYKEKNGKQDLEKAKHYIELLIELEYGNEANS